MKIAKSTFSRQKSRSGTGTHCVKDKCTGTTLSGTGTHWQCGTGTGTSQSGIGTTASYNPGFACYAILSPVFVHRLFRDPNKGLMGVQIGMKLSEKCTVLHRLDDIRLARFCSTSKSEEFVFD